MIIVLVSGGKRDDFDWVKVLLCTTRAGAEATVREYTKPGKYWSRAEIISPGVVYEPAPAEEADRGTEGEGVRT
jgi:hypothetical protein